MAVTRSDVLQGLCLDSRFKVPFHYVYAHVRAHEFACTMCMLRPGKGDRAPGTGVPGGACTTWALGTEPMYSARSVDTLNHEDTSLSP